MGTMQMFFLKKTLGDYANKFLTARDTYYVCRVEYGLAGSGLGAFPRDRARPQRWTVDLALQIGPLNQIQIDRL